jgi:A/G-specific adenine glycosylase
MTKEKAVRRALLRWYATNGRDLPWRHTRDPYAVLVSEYMLQQTQVVTVRSYYNEWLKRFPNFAALARASENDVLHAWEGLGYYARARNLHATAKTVQDRHRGRFPRDIATMRDLPGIGKYTAHAVASFAFDQAVPIVEANTARVLARLFNLQSPADSTAGRQRLWGRAAELVPRRNAADFNSALIDLGALVCLPRTPNCTICPVKTFCRAPRPELLPIKKPRRRIKPVTEHHAFIVNKNRILLQQAEYRWRGLWILPPLTRDRLKRSSSRRRPIYKSIFPFTQHRVALRVFRRNLRKIDNRSQHWFPIRQIPLIPIPSPHRRAILSLLSHPNTAAKGSMQG